MSNAEVGGGAASTWVSNAPPPKRTTQHFSPHSSVLLHIMPGSGKHLGVQRPTSSSKWPHVCLRNPQDVHSKVLKCLKLILLTTKFAG